MEELKQKRIRRRANGEGSISLRKDGYYIGQVTIGINPRTCKQMRKTVSAKTRKECSDKLNKLIADRDKGILVKSDNKTTVETWLYKWLDGYKKVTIKKTTYDSYYYHIKNHLAPQIGAYTLQKLTTDIVQNMINEMNDKTHNVRTIEYCVKILASAYKQALKLKKVMNNPCEDILLPKKEQKELVALTVDELIKFKNVSKGHYLYNAFLLQMTTGIRRGECLGLQIENVHLDEGYIRIKQHLVHTTSGIFLETPKTLSSIRDIPLIPEVIDALRLHIGKKKKGLVFTTKNGNYVHPRSYQRSFDLLLDKAGLIKEGQTKPRIHDLRHAFGTMLIKNGIDIKTVSILLGHADVRFTASVYIHPTMDFKRDAVDSIRTSFGS